MSVSPWLARPPPATEKGYFFIWFSAAGLQFSYKKIVLKPYFLHGFKTLLFYRVFEEALKGLIRSL